MNKAVYLFILLMINAHFWNLKMFSSFSNHDTIVILNILMYAYGYFKYKRSYHIDSKQYSWFYKIAFFAMVLSAISVVVFHDQKTIDTIFVYRAQIPLLLMPLLFRIQPSIEDIKKAISWATVVYIVFFFVSLALPMLFAVSAPEESSGEDFGYAFLARGNGMLWLYLFCFLLDDLSYQFSRKHLVMLCIFIFTVIVAQNRQTIIYVFAILLIFSMSKTKRKSIKLFLMSFLVAAVLYNSNILTSLYLETIDNTKADYGRAVSLPYFLYEHNENSIIDIIGNGMDSKKSAYGQYLTDLGKNYCIWTGDLGIVGIWSIYGILPVVAIVLLTVKVLKSHKYMPKSIVYIAMATFLCPYLISFAGGNLYWWAFLLYMYAYYDTLHRKKMMMAKSEPLAMLH